MTRSTATSRGATPHRGSHATVAAAVGTTLALIASPWVQAQDSQTAEVQALKQQVQDLQRRIDAIAARQADQPAAPEPK